LLLKAILFDIVPIHNPPFSTQLTAMTVKTKANMKAMKVAYTEPAKSAAMKAMKVMKEMKVKAMAEPAKGAVSKAMKVKPMKAMKAMNEGDLSEVDDEIHYPEDRVWYGAAGSGDVFFKCVRCGRVGMARRRHNATSTHWNCAHCAIAQPPWV
jgi:hypothetical protein